MIRAAFKNNTAPQWIWLFIYQITTVLHKHSLCGRTNDFPFRESWRMWVDDSKVSFRLALELQRRRVNFSWAIARGARTWHIDLGVIVDCARWYRIEWELLPWTGWTWARVPVRICYVVFSAVFESILDSPFALPFPSIVCNWKSTIPISNVFGNSAANVLCFSSNPMSAVRIVLNESQ
jgi:hypothetical protein